MNRYRRHIRYTLLISACSAALLLGGCKAKTDAAPGEATPSEALVIQAVPETIAPLGLNGQVLPNLNGVDLSLIHI